MKEIWKPISGFDDYEVSDHGRVKSYAGSRSEIGRMFNVHGRILSCTTTPRGYLGVSISKGGRAYFKRVHRLVLETFVDSPSVTDGICHHKDGNKLNNHLSNLEWSNHSKNVLASSKRGGEYHSKLKEGEIWLIKRLLKNNINGRNICKMFRISESLVSKIKTDQAWKHVGESI